MAVERDVEGLLLLLEKFEDVGGGWCVDNTGADELIHCFVIGGVGGIVDEAGAARVDASAKESHADAAIVGDALKGTDKIGAFKVLNKVSIRSIDRRAVDIPSIRASTGP